jgi:NTP pyrophosphatase (non-canonical NTP hydrolase)
MADFFTALRRAQLARCALWHADGLAFRAPAGWHQAACGEVGEALGAFVEHQRLAALASGYEELALGGRMLADVKLRRRPDVREALLDELADIACYMDLFAASLHRDIRDPRPLHAPIPLAMAVPDAAAAVLVIADTLHKLERARRDAGEAMIPEALGDRLHAQITEAFARLFIAIEALQASPEAVIADKFNAVSRRKGFAIQLLEKPDGWEAKRRDAAC